MILDMPWLHSAVDQFHQRMLNQRLPHAILFQGRVGVGAEVLARTIAQTSICQSPQLGYPCNQCKSCLLVQADTHPDYLKLEPGGASSTIRVEDIRSLVERFATTPQISARKVAVIFRAESMNTSAANALLKTLEEPPGNALLILVTEGTKPLLPTVRSRCQPFNISSPSRKQVTSWLTQNLKEQPSEELMAALDYQPLRIAQWVEEGMQQQWNQFQAMLSGVASLKNTPVFAAAECKDINCSDQLDWVDQRISAWVKAKVSQDKPLNTDWIRYADQLLELRRELLSGTNLNAQLFSESLFMLWQQFNRQLGQTIKA